MKASTSKLGLAIQLFLLRQGVSLEQLARETDLNADSLSNLIHGRRRFKDDTLRRLADSSLFKRGHFSYKKLRALKALDDYAFDELVLALLEGVRQGQVAAADGQFFQSLRDELSGESLPHELQEKHRAVLELIR